MGQKLTLEAIRKDVHDMALRFRALDAYVQGEEFKAAHRLAKSLDPIISDLQAANLDRIREWVDEIINREYADMSMRQLRELAGRLGIRYVSSYGKNDLIVRIYQAKNNEYVKPEEVPQ